MIPIEPIPQRKKEEEIMKEQEKTQPKMDQYKSVEKSMEELKRPVWIIFTIGVISQALLLWAGIERFLPKEAKQFSTLEACYYGMDSLFKYHPMEGLFHESVTREVKGHKFNIERITMVKVIDSYHCDVVAKGPKEFRSYRIQLERSSRFPHFYRIEDVQGQKLTSSYQWKGEL